MDQGENLAIEIDVRELWHLTQTQPYECNRINGTIRYIFKHCTVLVMRTPEGKEILMRQDHD